MMVPHVPHSVTAAYFLKRSGLWRQVKRWSPGFLQAPLRAAAFRNRASLTLASRHRRTLQEYYRDDILRLARMLNRNLDGWLT
jgi:hypothetical protein